MAIVGRRKVYLLFHLTGTELFHVCIFSHMIIHPLMFHFPLVVERWKWKEICFALIPTKIFSDKYNIPLLPTNQRAWHMCCPRSHLSIVYAVHKSLILYAPLLKQYSIPSWLFYYHSCISTLTIKNNINLCPKKNMSSSTVMTLCLARSPDLVIEKIKNRYYS